MKTLITITLLLLICISLVSCDSTDRECLPPPCVPPNINELIQLKLNLQQSATGDLLSLIRIYKASQEPFDTLQFEVPFNREMIIGQSGFVEFTPSISGAIESAALDFVIVYPDGQRDRISDIDIERTQEECSCSRYKIATLQLNGATVTLDTDMAELDL